MDFPLRQNLKLMPKYGTKSRGCPDEDNKRSARCKLGESDSLNFVKNIPLRIVFSSLLSVYAYPDDTLSRVWTMFADDMMLEKKYDVIFMAYWANP